MATPREIAYGALRRKHARHGALVAIAVSIALVAAGDDTIRCRSNRLVNVGMQAEQILSLCGEPKSRSYEDVPVRARGAGGGSIVIATTRVEKWVYPRGQGQFDALLSLEGGELVSIEILTTR